MDIEVEEVEYSDEVVKIGEEIYDKYKSTTYVTHDQILDFFEDEMSFQIDEMFGYLEHRGLDIFEDEESAQQVRSRKVKKKSQPRRHRNIHVQSQQK